MVYYVADATVTEKGTTPFPILIDLFPPHTPHSKMMLINQPFDSTHSGFISHLITCSLTTSGRSDQYWSMPARCGILNTQKDSALLETIQRRTLKIIYRNNDDYSLHLFISRLYKLSERRNNMGQKLFFENAKPITPLVSQSVSQSFSQLVSMSFISSQPVFKNANHIL